jgi:hypothetical protein
MGALQVTARLARRQDSILCPKKDSLIEAAKAGLSKLEEYSGYMKENDAYWIASILDPRAKTT